MEKLSDIYEQATDFVRRVFHIYFEERDVAAFRACLHPDVSWIGAGANEICRNLREADALLKAEAGSWDGCFTITKQWYDTIPISDGVTQVYGELFAMEKGSSPILLELRNRFSVTCKIFDGEWRILHLHCSSPNGDQQDGEFFGRHLVEDYRRRLAEALRTNEKRYEIAMRLSDVTTFEYNILTRQLFFFNDVPDIYGLPSVVEKGPETIVRRGILQPGCVNAYLDMYRRIDAGAPSASCIIKTCDLKGELHDYELSLTTIFDDNGLPQRAIGVEKNISLLSRLKKEHEFGKTMTADKLLICEVDSTRDRAVFIHEFWSAYIPVTSDMPFSEILGHVAKTVVAEEHQDMLLYQLSPEHIAELYAQGQKMFSFSYRRKVGSDLVEWYEATVTIIRDPDTESLFIRLYHANINDRKLKEQRAREEQYLYECMVARATLAYEFNLSLGIIVKGHELWGEKYGIRLTNDYDTMIPAFARRGICPDDVDLFIAKLNRASVLRAFKGGSRRTVFQYRKLDDDGAFRWMSCALHMFEDPYSGDVKGFAYVEDIDEQKRAELDLQYNAEHDMMTGLYNKVTAMRKIDAFLSSAESGGPAAMHAFLMIDLDYFKDINDNFGHMFGDNVLENIAGKIRSVFREIDIVGRLGGDEFCVFMKNIPSAAVATAKASELCDKIRHCYERDGRSVTLSASIGIALCRENGNDCEDLYSYADSALYTAKNSGRDRCSR
ncbi:MAG: diguanylate cyclase [Oscillospiraceae bacterium]